MVLGYAFSCVAGPNSIQILEGKYCFFSHVRLPKSEMVLMSVVLLPHLSGFQGLIYSFSNQDNEIYDVARTL